MFVCLVVQSRLACLRNRGLSDEPCVQKRKPRIEKILILVLIYLFAISIGPFNYSGNSFNAILRIFSVDSVSTPKRSYKELCIIGNLLKSVFRNGTDIACNAFLLHGNLIVKIKEYTSFAKSWKETSSGLRSKNQDSREAETSITIQRLPRFWYKCWCTKKANCDGSLSWWNI